MSVPDLIGRYRLGPRLGSGGFAVVWLAHDESLDTTIAINVLADIWAHRMDLRERFLSEAKMLRRASSTRIVQVFDIGELPDGRPYFVMEYADRGTLADRTEAGPLPLVAAFGRLPRWRAGQANYTGPASYIATSNHRTCWSAPRRRVLGGC